MASGVKGAMDPESRIRPADVARITSLSLRQVQSLASSGKIPGAAKLGGVWTFDPVQIRAWIRRQEQSCQRNSRPTATRGTASSGDVLSLPDENIDEAFERLIAGKRRGGSKHGGSSSNAKSSTI